MTKLSLHQSGFAKPWPYRNSANDRMFLSTENVDVVLAADAHDDLHSDIYYNASTIYPSGAAPLRSVPVRLAVLSPETL